MIAYNHTIQFIPASHHEAKHTVGSNLQSITIQENIDLCLFENQEYQRSFINNQGRNITLYTDRPFAKKISGQQWFFNIEDVLTFFWCSDTMIVEYSPGKYFTPELLEYWTLHILLPIFLTIEEHCYFLHAGAVEIDDTPILFIAESFGGKSTMTDFFMKQGHAMISDDKVGVLEKYGEFLAVPSHSHHRPYREMEDLGYFVENMSTSLKPIGAIYVLHRVSPDAKIAIEELKGIEKFKFLRFNSEINLSFLKSQRLQDLSRLAENVPVYKIMVPWNLERLEEVYQYILEHSTFAS